MLQKNGKETCRGAQQLAELASIGDMEIPLFQKRNENREATTATTTKKKEKAEEAFSQCHNSVTEDSTSRASRHFNYPFPYQVSCYVSVRKEEIYKNTTSYSPNKLTLCKH